MGINIERTVKEPFNMILQNPQILVPSVLPFVLTLITVLVVGGATLSPLALVTLGVMAIILFIITILSILVASGATTYMAFLQSKGEMPSYMDGINAAMDRLGALLIASIVIGVVGAVGLILFVIPGLIWLLLTAFTIPAIMIDRREAIDAIKYSIDIVKRNAGEVVVFLIILGIISYVISAVLSLIPIIGAPLGALISSAYSAIALTLAYLQIRAK